MSTRIEFAGYLRETAQVLQEWHDTAVKAGDDDTAERAADLLSDVLRAARLHAKTTPATGAAS